MPPFNGFGSANINFNVSLRRTGPAGIDANFHAVDHGSGFAAAALSELGLSGSQLRVKGKGTPLRWIVVEEVPVQMVLALDGACEVTTEKPGESVSIFYFATLRDGDRYGREDFINFQLRRSASDPPLYFGGGDMRDGGGTIQVQSQP